MPVSLAPSVSATASNDFIGASAAGLLFGAPGSDAACGETDPAASMLALGGAVRSLAPSDAAAILETLSAQAVALSLVLAADSGGAIRLPESLRRIVESASVLPSFLGGSPN